MAFLSDKAFERLVGNKGWREEEDVIICESLERGMTAKEIKRQLERVGYLRKVLHIKVRIADILLGGRNFDTIQEFRAHESNSRQ